MYEQIRALMPIIITVGRFIIIPLLLVIPLYYAAPRTNLSPLAQVLLHFSITLGLLMFFDFMRGGEQPPEGGDSIVLKDVAKELKNLASIQKDVPGQVRFLYYASQDVSKIDDLKAQLRSESEKSTIYLAELTEVRGLVADHEMRFRELEEELDRRLKQASELENQLKYSLSELELLKDSQEQRLGRIFPAELLSSEVGESVRWSSEAATQQDFIATAIFSCLQSLFASQLDPEASEQSLDCLRTLGRALSKMARREGWSSARRHEMFSAWARVLNGLSGNNFTLYVPDIGARVRNDTMTGLHDGTVSEVHCWGVRNHKQGIAYLAEVG